MADTVGCFNFFGNLAGNHHRGCLRSPCLIHVLKGVNMSFRRSCLKNFKFDEKLVYYGAEVGTEIDLCCSIRRGGFNVLYSNEIVVIHHTSHRPAGDGRRDLYGDAAARRLWNLGYLARKWLPAWQLPLYFAYFSLRGARVYPGVLMAIILLPILGPKVIPRLRFSLKYQIMGLLKA